MCKFGVEQAWWIHRQTNWWEGQPWWQLSLLPIFSWPLTMVQNPTLSTLYVFLFHKSSIYSFISEGPSGCQLINGRKWNGNCCFFFCYSRTCMILQFLSIGAKHKLLDGLILEFMKWVFCNFFLYVYWMVLLDAISILSCLYFLNCRHISFRIWYFLGRISYLVHNSGSLFYFGFL